MKKLTENDIINIVIKCIIVILIIVSLINIFILKTAFFEFDFIDLLTIVGGIYLANIINKKDKKEEKIDDNILKKCDEFLEYIHDNKLYDFSKVDKKNILKHLRKMQNFKYFIENLSEGRYNISNFIEEYRKYYEEISEHIDLTNFFDNENEIENLSLKIDAIETQLDKIKLMILK